MKKYIRSFFVVIGVSLAAVLLHFSGILSFLENKTFDSRTKFAASYCYPSQDICFITVDQESINWARREMGWGWPWPRKALGDVVNYMNISNAESIAFDVLFTEPSVYGDDDDEAFGKACADYGRVVHAMYADDASSSSDDLIFPVDPIRRSAGVIGSTVSAKDGDDVQRRARISFISDDAEYPSLGVAPLVISGMTIDEIRQSYPVEKEDTLLLRYRKNLGVYNPYRASDVLQSYYDYIEGREPLIPPESFEGAYVYYAYYAPGLFDICSSPISQVYPGCGVHVTELDNFLSNDFMRTVPTPLSVAWIVFASVLGILAISFTEARRSSLGNALSAVGTVAFGLAIITAGSFALFVMGWYILLVAPLAAFAFSFLLQLALTYMLEGRQKRFIKAAFSQYLSPAVIDQLISNPDSLRLGGEEREISIFFSDVQGFTSISEGLAKNPTKLTEVLNLYLSEMSSIILKSGGTIDKYEGDAIIAFWNAPADQEDHAARILGAALECQKRLDELRSELKKMTGKDFYQRIGMNTGHAVVGNMGSSNRFDYTMLGDSVNLASRLEGLNKQFGTYTMCSKATMESALAHGCKLHFREIARVAVVGKKEAVTVYEPMPDEVYAARKELIESFDKGRKLFYEGDFAGAKAVFDLTKESDPPASFYSDKCAELMANPPSEWQGVWKASSK
ncbi:MAG: adenylate/guanylate cyclase domain-containing protein [Treponema sp.]|nr:adenylate/guanylate cyclase domain-containing protein [Treponema sp.]